MGHYAASRFGRAALVRALAEEFRRRGLELEFQQVLFITDGDDRSCLYAAAKEGHIEAARALIEVKTSLVCI